MKLQLNSLSLTTLNKSSGLLIPALSLPLPLSLPSLLSEAAASLVRRPLLDGIWKDELVARDEVASDVPYGDSDEVTLSENDMEEAVGGEVMDVEEGLMGIADTLEDDFPKACNMDWIYISLYSQERTNEGLTLDCLRFMLALPVVELKSMLAIQSQTT